MFLECSSKSHSASQLQKPLHLQDENDSTLKTMSSLRKKLGKVMSKSAGRKGGLL